MPKKIIDIINISRYTNWSKISKNMPSYIIAIFDDDSAEIVCKYDANKYKVNTGSLLKHIENYDTMEKLRAKILAKESKMFMIRQ